MRTILLMLTIWCMTGCNGRVAKTDTQTEQKYYNTTCSRCGAVFSSTSQKPIDNCPNCPLDVCMETVGYILQLGTLNEIVRAQPENTEAKENKLLVEEKFKKHLSGCEQCQQSVKENDQ